MSFLLLSLYEVAFLLLFFYGQLAQIINLVMTALLQSQPHPGLINVTPTCVFLSTQLTTETIGGRCDHCTDDGS